MDSQELWAIACHFNPAGWLRRLDNFRRFRRALTVPLLAVELSYRGEYELQSEDATRLLRLRGHDVMWQKERLLNLALAALPEGCGAVAWLDADVLFRDDDWPRAAVQALERAPLVQLFHRALYTGRGFLLTGDPSIIWDRPGLAAGIASGLAPLECLLHPAPDARPKTYATGLAWAARRDLLRRHGFYDANIIGGGDRALVCAALGCFDYEIKSHRLNARQTEHYLHWAKPFHADVGGMVGVIQGEILHLWHGDRANRGYGPRHRGLAQFDFDPLTDIAPDQGGVYRWASPKPNLHAFVADYFASRREDGQ